jgi:predicted phosphoribosyltransferase
VAFDGTVSLNEELISALRLTEEEIQRGIDRTRRKVVRRTERLRGGAAFPDLSRCPAILVDDGLASGFTLLTAIRALRGAGAGRIIVAVPTGSRSALQRVATQAERLYCANVRRGAVFAVADAYEHWSDVDEEEIAKILSSFPS